MKPLFFEIGLILFLFLQTSANARDLPRLTIRVNTLWFEMSAKATGTCQSYFLFSDCYKMRSNQYYVP